MNLILWIIIFSIVEPIAVFMLLIFIYYIFIHCRRLIQDSGLWDSGKSKKFRFRLGK